MTNFPPLLRLALLSFALLGGIVCSAAAEAPKPFLQLLFTDHMVLQRDAMDPVWGWTDPGAKVTVELLDPAGHSLQKKTDFAGQDGRWQIPIGPFGLIPNNAACTMHVTGPGTTTATVSDILIGDVWLCSGQSNMEYTLSGNVGGTRLANSDNEIAAARASWPQIRQLKINRGWIASTPQDTFLSGAIGNGWQTTAQDAQDFTAVGFFMAKEIYQHTQVPIGLLNLTWGGTDIDPWASPDALRKLPDYTGSVDGMKGSFPPRTTDWPNMPKQTQIYYSMIAPAAGFAIKGFAWLQGESSAAVKTEQSYEAVFEALREGIRTTFNNPKLPFVIIQIGAADKAQTVPVELASDHAYQHYAEIRNAQLTAALDDPHSRIVTGIDCIYLKNPGTNFMSEVHNINKQTIGKRAGDAALNLAYGVKDAPLSPTLDHAVQSGDSMRCTFRDVGPGLMVGAMPQGLHENTPPSPSPVVEVKNGVLTGFALKGFDNVFHFATAKIDPTDNSVIVTSPDVPQPVAVRYGWATNPWDTHLNAPLCNLYRKIVDPSGAIVDGIPVVPFKSDVDPQPGDLR